MKKGKVRMKFPVRTKATPTGVYGSGQKIVSSNPDPRGVLKKQYVLDGKPDRRKEVWR